MCITNPIAERLNTREGFFFCLVSQTIFAVSCWFCCAVLSAEEAFTYTSSRALGHCIHLIWLCGCSYFSVSLVTALYLFPCWHVSAACSVLVQKSALFACCKMTENQDTVWDLSPPALLHLSVWVSPAWSFTHVWQEALSGDRAALQTSRSSAKKGKL